MSVIQQAVTWRCLFYSRLCYLDVYVLQLTVLLRRVCSTAACPAPGRDCYKVICAALGLGQSVHAFAVSGGGGVSVLRQLVLRLDVYVYKSLFCTHSSLYTRTLYWAAHGSVCLRKPLLHLYCALGLLLDVPVYKSFCAAPGRVCLHNFCAGTCLSTVVFVLHLNVQIIFFTHDEHAQKIFYACWACGKEISGRSEHTVKNVYAWWACGKKQ